MSLRWDTEGKEKEYIIINTPNVGSEDYICTLCHITCLEECELGMCVLGGGGGGGA